MKLLKLTFIPLFSMSIYAQQAVQIDSKQTSEEK